MAKMLWRWQEQGEPPTQRVIAGLRCSLSFAVTECVAQADACLNSSRHTPFPFVFEGVLFYCEQQASATVPRCCYVHMQPVMHTHWATWLVVHDDALYGCLVPGAYRRHHV